MEAPVPAFYNSSSSDARSAESTEDIISGQTTSPVPSAEPANHLHPMLGTSNAATLAETIHPLQSLSKAGAESADHEMAPSVMGPLTLAEHIKVMQLQIQHDLQELQQCKDDDKKYVEMCTPERVIADVEKIVELCQGVCDVEGCWKKRRVTDQKLEVGVLLVKFCCEKGHKGVWCSSKVRAEKRTKTLCATYFNGSCSIGHWQQF